MLCQANEEKETKPPLLQAHEEFKVLWQFRLGLG